MRCGEKQFMKRRNLEIYIHVPFCVKKCGYCDFLSAPADGDIRERYVQALACEIEGRAAQCREYEVSTVYFGGGTPSLLTPEQMARLLMVLKRHYLVSSAAEITMEANPGTVDCDSLTQYHRAGVNRLSLGLQSSWDEELKALGRIHTWRQFLEAYEAAGAAGFTHVNVDLMCGLPGQTLTSYETTLRRVAELIPEPEHISAYSLILEEGTDFTRRYEAGELKLPDEETERELYGLTEQVLQEYGYRRYEISNYAQAGCECRHNVGYWTRENYLGVGIGAASLMENQRFQNGENLQAYLENPLRQRQQEHQLSVAEQMEEYMFLGLRLTEGVEAGLFEKTFHCGLEQVYGEVIRRHVAQGLLAYREGASGRFLHLTPKGLDLANYVMADFLDPLV